jgi:hypothetical protein
MQRLLVPLLLIGVAGCASTRITTLGPGKGRAPISPEEVSIYRTREQVPGKYEEVALIETTQSTGKSDANMLENMREKAAEVGANGIVIEEIEQASSFRRSMMPLSSTRRGKALAIYVYPLDKSVHATTTESKGPQPVAAATGSSSGVSTSPEGPPQPTAAPRISTAPGGRLRVLTDPVGADVYIGDLRVGTTTPEGLLLDLPAARVSPSRSARMATCPLSAP